MSRSQRLLDRLSRDESRGEIRDGGIRYLMIRPDALMSMFRNLPESAREQALAAFARSIFEHGGRSAQSYRDRGASEAGQLLQVIEDTASQLGWGRWHFDRSGGDLRLTVANSPFAAGYGPSDQPVCAAITGMLQAVSGLVLGAVTVAEEVSCAAQGHTVCGFRASRGGSADGL